MTTIKSLGRHPHRSRLRVESLEPRLALASGTLDPTFDIDGFAQTSFGAVQDNGRAVAFQADGKIVVGGTSIQNGYQNFALARYNADGSLDSTFGTGGKTVVNFGSKHNAALWALTIQPDGKIVAAGHDVTLTKRNMAVVRFNPNGSLDTKFGDTSGKSQTGKIITPDVGQPTGITLQDDGKILVGTGKNG